MRWKKGEEKRTKRCIFKERERKREVHLLKKKKELDKRNGHKVKKICIREREGIGDFFFQAENGIRDFCQSRGLGDVYKGKAQTVPLYADCHALLYNRLLHTSDTADELLCADPGGRRSINNNIHVTLLLLPYTPFTLSPLL